MAPLAADDLLEGAPLLFEQGKRIRNCACHMKRRAASPSGSRHGSAQSRSHLSSRPAAHSSRRSRGRKKLICSVMTPTNKCGLQVTSESRTTPQPPFIAIRSDAPNSRPFPRVSPVSQDLLVPGEALVELGGLRLLAGGYPVRPGMGFAPSVQQLIQL